MGCYLTFWTKKKSYGQKPSLTRTDAKTDQDCRFFFFFFTQVQTPVTLCSGELWSILVVRLAHSADLRSRLRHVSSAPSVAYSTRCSRVVTHPGTNPARRCLTSVIWREALWNLLPLYCEFGFVWRKKTDSLWKRQQRTAPFLFVVQEDKFCKREILDLKVKCPNHVEGCQHVTGLREIEVSVFIWAQTICRSTSTFSVM